MALTPADYRLTGVFLNHGSQRPINDLLAMLRKGDPQLRVYLHMHCTPRQCATALMAFLRSRRRPLLPQRVQQLLIGPNERISASTVATDALGLLKQDIHQSNNLILLYALFDLLRTLTTVGSLRPTEIRTSIAPQLIMPFLFKSSVRA